MTNIYLHGELRNLFGHEFRYNISKPREAFSAINANRRGFLNAVKRLASKGVFYRIVVDDAVIENIAELDITKTPKEIHLVPVIWGAGKNLGNILLIVAAVAIVVATGGLGTTALVPALAAGNSLAGLGTALNFLAAALFIQGVTGILFPPPKPDFNQEVSAGGKSYLFGSKPSNTSQGQAVPVGYGRLMIGSSQVSASINNYKLALDTRSIMTPAAKPIDTIPVYDGIDEIEIDGYRSNQTAIFDDVPSVVGIELSESYIDIVSKSAKKVSSNVVELRVKQNGEVISNPNTSSFDEDLTYKWTLLKSSDGNKGAIQQENSYSFSDGMVYRFSRPQEFKLISDAAQNREDSNYMISYPVGSLVIWGPSQFEKLPKPAWNNNTRYVFGEIVNVIGIYYRCTANIPATATITAATRSASTVTITTSSNHGFESGLKAVISGLSKGNANPNGTYTITVTSVTQFTYTLTGTNTGTETYTVSSGTAVLQTPPPIKKSYIASASRTNSVVTVVLGDSATPLNPIDLTELNGSTVQISNLIGSPSLVVDPNGTYTITRVNDTTFTYTLAGSFSGTETYTVVEQSSDVLNEYEKTSVMKLTTNTFWSLFIPPIRELIYRATAISQGYLPTDTSRWTTEDVPVNSAAMDSYLSYVRLPDKQDLYLDEFSNVNVSKVTDNDSQMGQYTLEFIGYFYIPLNKTSELVSPDPLSVREINVLSAVNGTIYEITKVGDPAQWSTIGVGSVTPVVGMTFTKNATAATGNGKVAPVYQYDFKIELQDQNDAFVDLYVNGIAASSHLEGTSPTVTAVRLGTGYHRIYARMRAGASQNKFTISYRRTGAASYQTVSENQMLNRKNYDNLIPLNQAIYNQRGDIPAASMVTGKKYRINVVGTGANWTSVGATTATVGTVFRKNSTAFVGTGAFASEAFDLATIQADNQRLVTFAAEREDTGYARYVSYWQCEVTKGVNTYTSPTVRVGVTFLSTQAESIVRSVPPIQTLLNPPSYL